MTRVDRGNKMVRLSNVAMLLSGAAVSALLTASAWAQTAAQTNNPAGATQTQGAGGVESVVVTGTQIRGAAPVGSTLITIDRDQFMNTGATTTNEILQQQPQVFNFGIADTQRNGTGGAGNITYASSVNLRGLSPFATLTLVDGHRDVPSGTLGAAVDPSTIPTVMLSNIAIVADGASATYGSDAIAGVVNLILRRNLEGVEATARGGWGNSYDEQQFNIAAGHQWDGGQLTVGVEYSNHSALSGLSRAFYTSNQTAFGGSDFRVNNCNPGTIVASGKTYAIPAGGVTPATAGQLAAGTQNLCDPLKTEDLIPQQTHYNVAFTFDQKVTDWMSVYAEGHYSRRDYRRSVPEPSGPLTVTSANPYFVAPPGSGVTSETVDYWFGNQGLGNTALDGGYSINEQIVAGVNIKLGGDWLWETEASYGVDHDEEGGISGDGVTGRSINLSGPQVAAALASTNPATALNLFGPNSLTLLNSLNNAVSIAPGVVRQQVVESKVDGSIFQLPGGAVRGALGVQYERDTLADGLFRGTLQAPPAINYQHLARDATAVYGELLVPIVGDGNSIEGIQALNLDAGMRYTNYTVVGATTNPKFGLDWTVVDGLKLRGSYGSSFRAPALSELVGPVTAVFVQTYSTPTGPVQGYTLGGGNTTLKPETAITWSIGGDWTPDVLPGTKFSINYFNISYKNQVSSYLSNLSILNNPGKYGSLITFCPSAACSTLIAHYITGPTAEPVFGPILPNPAVFVNGLEQNLATTRTNGFDLQALYTHDTGGWGTVDLGFTGTIFTQFDQSPVPGAAISDELNHIGFPLTFRFRANVGWSDGPWSAALYLNYANAYTNDLSSPPQSVSAYATLDTHLSYDLGNLGLPELDDARLALDVTNLFDSDPPYVNLVPNPNGGGGFDPQNANPIGRIVAISLQTRF